MKTSGVSPTVYPSTLPRTRQPGLAAVETVVEIPLPRVASSPIQVLC
jgi:hypothetical protein